MNVFHCLLVPLLVCASLCAGAPGSAEVITVEGILTYVDSSECYMEQSNRSSGLRVIGTTDGLVAGVAVSATGTRDSLDGEACIRDATVTAAGQGAEIGPFGLGNRWIGGATTSGASSVLRDLVGVEWRTSDGTPNTGLLVTTWGRINSVYYSPTTGASWFYIDDGSELVSDYGDTGVLVYSDAEIGRGQFVSATGISSVEVSLDNTGRLIRVIRTRTTDDVSVRE